MTVQPTPPTPQTPQGPARPLGAPPPPPGAGHGGMPPQGPAWGAPGAAPGSAPGAGGGPGGGAGAGAAAGAGAGGWAPAPVDGAKDAPGTWYTSPIAIKRTHLGHALASEWTKIRTVRSTMWTLGIFLLLVIGIGLLVAAQTHDQDYVDVPYTVPAFFGVILGQICLITLGVLVISSEYGTGMIRTTFTASPQRHRVLAAKILVYFVVVFVIALIAIGLVALATSQLHADASSKPWGGTAVKGALYVSLLGVLSLAVGSILRHSAGAITAMLGLVLVPAILPAFLLISDSTRDIGEAMAKYSVPNSLARVFQLDTSGTGTRQLLLLVGVTVAAVIVAFVELDRRDV